MSNVAYTQGQDLYATTRRTLSLIEGEIRPLPTVLIKPNFVSTRNQLSATEVDQVRAIADFVRGKCSRIVVAESPAGGKAADGYRNYGYLDRLEGVEFLDLADTAHRPVPVFDKAGREIEVNVSELLMDEDTFVVSAGKLKTHNAVVATLAAKNVIMCSMNEKDRMHQGYPMVNRNLVEVMKRLHIDLAVLDGINAMEGNGPGGGTRKNAGCVIASADYLAADRVALEVMGIDPGTVGYLTYLHELGLGQYRLDRIEILGDRLKVTPFRLHDCVEEQYAWR